MISFVKDLLRNKGGRDRREGGERERAANKKSVTALRQHYTDNRHRDCIGEFQVETPGRDKVIGKQKD